MERVTCARDALRVLQVTTDDDRRGGQIFATDLEHGLRALGHDVATVGLAPGAVGGLAVPTLGRRRRHPRTLLALRRRIIDADVVVGHGSTTLPMCAAASMGTGVPFVYRQISDSHFWANTAARRLRVRRGLRRADRVVALWAGAAEVLIRDFGVIESQVVCIPNAVPPERFEVPDVAGRRAARTALGVAPDAVVVAYVGALAPEKGVGLAIDVTRHRDDVVLLIAGDGADRQTLERRAAGRGDRVRFIGSVAQPCQVYAAADAVIFPSRGGDSMPATLIEAGMMGLPVIATSVAAVPEVVQDDRTGLVIPPEDDVALRAALDRVCDDPELRVALGREARRLCIERFSIDVVSSAWADVLLATAPTRRPARDGRRGARA